MKILCSLTVLSAAITFSSGVFGQDTTGDNTANTTEDQPVEGKGTGISGGIMGGAEVVLLVEAAFDVKPVWPWIVFPILGAGGGGIGGYYLEKNSTNGSIALLVSSMVMLIPTAVIVSVARAYDPEDDGIVVEGDNASGYSFEMTPSIETGDEGTVTEVESRPEETPEESDTPQPEASIHKKSRNEMLSHLTSGSLFHVNRNLDAGFGVPRLDVRPTSLSDEELKLGAPRGVEFSLSLLRIDLP